MHQTTKIKITELNPHLICVLCGGYFIDATTIIECLHSFCRACIIKYLETSKYCPICDVQVHKTKPLLNIRSDQTLQDVVYKLVPGLFHSEMQKRRDFYKSRKDANPVNSEDGGETPHLHFIYSPDESISLSLDYVWNRKKESSVLTKEEEEAKESLRRYLRCPAAVSIGNLKKLIRAKFGLTPEYRVDIMYTDEPLRENYTLMDIAYIYLWKRVGPMQLYYRIYEQPNKKLKLDDKEKPKMVEKMDCSSEESKKLEVRENPVKGEVKATPAKEDVTEDKGDEKGEWKEVQLQISESGEISVMDMESLISPRESEVISSGRIDDSVSGSTIEEMVIVEDLDIDAEKKAEQEKKKAEKLQGKEDKKREREEKKEEKKREREEKKEEKKREREEKKEEKRREREEKKLEKHKKKDDEKMEKRRKKEDVEVVEHIQEEKAVLKKSDKGKVNVNQLVESKTKEVIQGRVEEEAGKVDIKLENKQASTKVDDKAEKTCGEIKVQVQVEDKPTRTEDKVQKKTGGKVQNTPDRVQEKPEDVENKPDNMQKKTESKVEVTSDKEVKDKGEHNVDKILENKLDKDKNDGDETKKDEAEASKKAKAEVHKCEDEDKRGEVEVKRDENEAKNGEGEMKKDTEQKNEESAKNSGGDAQKLDSSVKKSVEEMAAKKPDEKIADKSGADLDTSKSGAAAENDVKVAAEKGSYPVVSDKKPEEKALAEKESVTHGDAGKKGEAKQDPQQVPKDQKPAKPQTNASQKKSSSRVGYKTLKAPPKTWNPSISRNMLSPVPKATNGSNANANAGNLSVNGPDSKPPRFFKARNLPRYLGNPAAGVKPMFPAQGQDQGPKQAPTSTVTSASMTPKAPTSSSVSLPLQPPMAHLPIPPPYGLPPCPYKFARPNLSPLNRPRHPALIPMPNPSLAPLFGSSISPNLMKALTSMSNSPAPVPPPPFGYHASLPPTISMTTPAAHRPLDRPSSVPPLGAHQRLPRSPTTLCHSPPPLMPFFSSLVNQPLPSKEEKIVTKQEGKSEAATVNGKPDIQTE